MERFSVCKRNWGVNFYRIYYIAKFSDLVRAEGKEYNRNIRSDLIQALWWSGQRAGSKVVIPSICVDVGVVAGWNELDKFCKFDKPI